MRFSATSVFSAALAASSVQAVVIPQKANSELVERQVVAGILVSVATAAGTAAASKAGELAVNAAANLIKDITNFDSAREAFTQATTKEMFANNPDPSRFVAAICYNAGFEVRDPAGASEVTIAKVSSGPLNTDYSCMYMGRNNQFFTFGDGGFINLSFTATDDCTFDSETADLTCN